MAEKYIKTVDWQWEQGTYGHVVVFTLVDKQYLSTIDLDNYTFIVNVQRGESPKNTYTAPCNVLDTDTKKVEYVVREGDLTIGDEYYYIDLIALHPDPNPLDDYLDKRRINAQEVVRVFVRRKKEN